MRKITYRVKSSPANMYAQGSLITSEDLINDYVASLRETEDADHIGYITTTDPSEAVAYICDAWGIELTTVSIDVTCPVCGGKLIWQNDIMAKDVFTNPDEYDDEAIVTDYVCGNCGRLITVTDPTKEEKKSLYFWQKK